MSFKKPMMVSPETPVPSITNMGQDLIVSILHLLPVESILSLSMSCRRFRDIGSTDSVWEFVCRRDWGGCCVDDLLKSRDDGGLVEWKKVYREVFRVGGLSCRWLGGGGGGVVPRPRASHSLCLMEDWLVVFGGGHQGGRHLDDTWVSDIGNGFSRVPSWQKVSSGTPSGRFGHSCTIVGDALVLFGGISDNGGRQNDTWIGEANRESGMKILWRLLDAANITPPPRGAHAACHAGDHKMVIHGGIGLDGLRLNDTWMLDLSDGFRYGTWQPISNAIPLPPARSGHSLTWIGPNHIILFAGRGVGLEVLSDVWLLNTEGELPHWKELKCDASSNAPCEKPFPRSGHSATLIIGGKVLIYGGEDSERHRKNDFWILDVSALLIVGLRRTYRKVWRKIRAEGQCPGYRSFHGACTDLSGRRIFVFGGMADGGIHPGEAHGLRFDGELYAVELALNL